MYLPETARNISMAPHSILRYPAAGSGRFRKREHLQLGGHKEAEDLNRMLDPFNIGNDDKPVPTEQMALPNHRVLPHRVGIHATEVRRGFIVKPNHVVVSKRRHYGGDKNGCVVFLSHMLVAYKGADVVGEPFKAFYHLAFLGLRWNDLMRSVSRN